MPASDSLARLRLAVARSPRAQDWERLGELEERLGFPGAAWTSLRRALALSPRAAPLRRRAARLRVRLGDYPGARAELRAALALDPRAWEAWLDRHALEDSMGLENAARASLRRARRELLKSLGRGPADWERRRQAADILERLGEFPEALRFLRPWAGEAGVPPDLRLRLARLELWLGRTREAARAAANSDCPRLLGACAGLERRFDDADRLLTRALKLDPRDAEALIWRAEFLRARGLLPEARRAADAALGMSDNALGANANNALVKLAQGEVVSALEYSLIARLLPRHLSRLKASLRPQVPQEAARALEKILDSLGGNRSQTKVFRRGPASAPALSAAPALDVSDRLERLQSRLRDGRIEPVLARFAALRRREPRQAWHCAFRGETFLWLGRIEEAEADFRRALALEKNLRWPYVGLAAAAMLGGRFKEALAHCARAERDRAPERSWRAWRGETLLRMGRAQEAARDLEFAATAMPRRLSAWMNLSLARRASGDPAAADAAFRRARVAAPHFFELCAAEAGLALPPLARTPDAADCSELLALGLERMRGNRSSWLYTFVDDAGRLRPIHAEF